MQNLICFGDSITHGADFPEGRRWTAVLQQQLELHHPGKFEVYNRGIGGNTSTQGLERFLTAVEPLLPGIVLLEFGLNDASIRPGRLYPRCPIPQFEKNLQEILLLIRAKKGFPVLMTNHIIASKRPPKLVNGKLFKSKSTLAPHQTSIREVAANHHVPLIDLEASMKQARLKASDIVCEDGVHLTIPGNRIYAEHVLAGLLPILNLKSR